jgi:hypothetical protein
VLKALRELGEFALSLCFDLVELLLMLQVPVVATSIYGADKVRALQLSALVTIVTLIVWASTTSSDGAEWPTIGVISTIYLSASAWLVYKYLGTTVEYEAKSDLRLDALSVVLTFNLLVILVATVTRELNSYLEREYREFPSLDAGNLRLVLLVLPVLVAGLVTVTNSLRYKKAGEAGSRTHVAYLHIGLFTLLNIVLADTYVYLMFVVALPS